MEFNLPRESTIWQSNSLADICSKLMSTYLIGAKWLSRAYARSTMLSLYLSPGLIGQLRISICSRSNLLPIHVNTYPFCEDEYISALSGTRAGS